MSYDESIRLGERAEQLLQDEVLAGVFRSIETDCIKNWRDSGAAQEAEREKIWQYLKMADAVKRELERIRDGGKMSKAALDQENRAREFEKARGYRPHT